MIAILVDKKKELCLIQPEILNLFFSDFFLAKVTIESTSQYIS
jgi:hypothetical protein